MRLWRAWRVIVVVLALLPGVLRAEDDLRSVLGYGRLFTNDALGDGHDRWRTGSHLLAVVTGPPWGGQLPAGPGQVLEYRLRSEIIAPWRMRNGRADRPYVGALSFGVHTHARLGAADYVLGADLVVVGPQTGLADFQIRMHDILGLRPPTGTDHQIGNSVFLALSGEIARPHALWGDAVVRPYAALRAGDENLLRVGADLLVGPGAADSLFTRDVVTGHLVRVAGHGTPHVPGAMGVVGWDAALVGDSRFLPQADGVVLRDTRWRARSGLHWRLAGGGGLFAGLVWLSPEFVGQPEGQLLGSFRVDFNF